MDVLSLSSELEQVLKKKVTIEYTDGSFPTETRDNRPGLIFTMDINGKDIYVALPIKSVEELFDGDYLKDAFKILAHSHKRRMEKETNKGEE